MGVAGDDLPIGGDVGADPCGCGELGAIFSTAGTALPCAEEDAPELDDDGSTLSTASPASANTRSISGPTRSAIALLAAGSVTAGVRGS